MSMSVELFIYICLFALGLGVVAYFLGDSDNERHKLRAEHEGGRYPRKRAHSASPRAKTASARKHLTPVRTHRARSPGFHTATATPTRK